MQFIIDELRDQRVLILGFGKEGQSTFRFLRSIIPGMQLIIADQDESLPSRTDPGLNDEYIIWCCGPDYLDSVFRADVIIKSPGIPYKNLPPVPVENITSQTEWFVRAFKNQITGITGTKGKSTTSTLLHHMLLQAKRDTLLVGNIGIPPLSVIEKITPETAIVFEMSCHQLQHIRYSPHIALLLNIFQEHLDHYDDLEEYQLTKLNIARHQTSADKLIFNYTDQVSRKLLKQHPPASSLIPVSLQRKTGTACFSDEGKVTLRTGNTEIILLEHLMERRLMGEHNLLNIMAAATAAYLLNISTNDIRLAVSSFQPLEHRLESVGIYNGISFYNDSISTVPESTIEALKALKDVHTLILGGVDRNIAYTQLTAYLRRSTVKTLIIIGMAGRRIKSEFDHAGESEIRVIEASDYPEVIEIAMKTTPAGKVCLLSPAAASYDWFTNFEERGRAYKDLIRNYKH